jgi:hypothetical protein
MKLLDQIKAHPAVDSVEDGRAFGDGYFVYLKPGYTSRAMDCGTIHEPTLSACLRVMREGIIQTQEG